MDQPKLLGVNTRYYPTQATAVGERPIFIEGMGEVDQTRNPHPVRAVLVEGDIGDYACYVGVGDPLWVARFGDKISFEEACCHFPGGQLEREKYRL